MGEGETVERGRPDRLLSREEIARRDLGSTSVSIAQQVVLTGAFLATIFGVPAVQQARDIYAGFKGNCPSRWPQCTEIVRQTTEAVQRFFDVEAGSGTVTRLFAANRVLLRGIPEYERRLEDHSLLQAALLPPAQAAMTRYLGVGNEEVYTGLGGWLFYRPGIDSLTGPGFLTGSTLAQRRRGGNEWRPPPQPDPVAAILQFQAQLLERGIELVLVPTPGKSCIYPQRFSRRYGGGRAPLHNSSYEQMLQELRTPQVFFEGRFSDYAEVMRNPQEAERYGDALAYLSTMRKQLEAHPVRVLDVSGDVSDANGAAGTYLPTDTHWSPDGMERAAAGLATFLRESGVLPARPAVNYQTATASVQNDGDLVAMLRLRHPERMFAKQEVTIRPVRSADGSRAWQPDHDADVLLLGDSFSNIFSDPGLRWGEGAGLAERLSYHLKRPVDAIRRNDEGAYATRHSLLRECAGGRDRLAGKAVVVWQFAARELAGGDWKLLKVRPGAAVDTKTTLLEPEAGESLLITGVVQAHSPIPVPGKAPYRDHIFWLHLVDIAGPGVGAGRSEALVYMQSMRDNRLTEAAGVREGRKVTIRIQPWAEVADRYGRMRRDDPEAEELALASPFWGVLPNGAAEPERTQLRADLLREEQGRSVTPGDPVTRPTATDAVTTFREACRLAGSNPKGQIAVVGHDGWLLHAAELLQIAGGRFWGNDAGRANPNRKTSLADPLAAIVAYSVACRVREIQLLVVPIPGKTLVYPEAVLGPSREGMTDAGRLDAAHLEFYEALRTAGVTVIDLVPAFREAKRTATDPLFCRQDTHFSGVGCRLTASRIAAGVRTTVGATREPGFPLRSEDMTLQMEGDLRADLGASGLPPEPVLLHRVGTGSELTPVPLDPDSPVLLLADSHGLVFHEGGEMHAIGAGLPDQLAAELGYPIDMIAVKGSAARPARIALYRRAKQDPEWLGKKKVIVWCFTIRELSESSWGEIPLAKQ